MNFWCFSITHSNSKLKMSRTNKIKSIVDFTNQTWEADDDERYKDLRSESFNEIREQRPDQTKVCSKLSDRDLDFLLLLQEKIKVNSIYFMDKEDMIHMSCSGFYIGKNKQIVLFCDR